MIKNIIFDLGGVVLNIDYHKTATAFSKLGAVNFDSIYTQSKQITLFDDVELGKITSTVFREELKKQLKLNVPISNLTLPGMQCFLICHSKDYILLRISEINSKYIFLVIRMKFI